MKSFTILSSSACLAVFTLMHTSSLSAATFADDVAFLRQHVEVITLQSGTARAAVVPAWQGRLMTTSAKGDDGLSFGWINRSLIASRKLEKHINVFGGEDRFWLGPEGGQFSIFFAKGVPFDLEHWFTPAALDTEPFEVVRKEGGSVVFRRGVSLTNYSGTVFDLEVERAVRMMTPAAAWKALGVAPVDGVQMVGVETDNKITNKGKVAWTRETGMLSIWILGMFNPSPETTIVIPLKNAPGKAVNADYFGRVPDERLVIKDNTAFFSGDGRYRSKIGVGPRHALPVLGSYDAAHQTLTLAHYTLPGNTTDYVNSMWELQKEPFAGDVVNSYNDGPPSPGAKPLGPFYELESSSPAAALKPGESLTHVHRTLHFTGEKAALDAIARATLGVGIEAITRVFAK